jgi:hypothetical protein
MSFVAAYRFIVRVTDDAELKSRLNASRDLKELNDVLKNSVGLFGIELFDDAIRSLRVHCRDANQAQNLQEIRSWWHRLLVKISQEGSCQTKHPRPRDA